MYMSFKPRDAPGGQLYIFGRVDNSKRQGVHVKRELVGGVGNGLGLLVDGQYRNRVCVKKDQLGTSSKIGKSRFT